ncbi:Nitrogen permease regulator 2, partial [Ascosphaera atra]
KIVPFINGVNSILMISVLSDVDFSLTCRAIRHLVYYGCVFLLDIFSFSAIYAPTAQFGLTIAVDEEMQRECAGYVNMRFAPSQPSVPADPIVVSSPVGSVPMPGSPKSIVQRRSQTQGKGPEGKNMDDMLEDVWPELDVPGPVDPLHKRTIDGVGIVELYADLRQGKTVKQWYLQNADKLANIDVRRFITFGIIKGFLYRVHKYAIATNEPAPHLMHTYSSGQSLAYRNRFPPTASLTEAQASNKLRRMLGDQDHPHHHHHHHQHPHHVHTSGPCSIIGDGDSAHLDVGVAGDRDTKDWDEDEDDPVDDRTLAKYLNGTHCFDQICMELEMTDSELMMRLKRYPYIVQVIHR